MRSLSNRFVLPAAFALIVVPILIAGCDSSALTDTPTTTLSFDIASYNYDGMSTNITIDEASINVRAVEFVSASGDVQATKAREIDALSEQETSLTLDPESMAGPSFTYELTSGVYNAVRFEVFQPAANEILGDVSRQYAVVMNGYVDDEPFELKIDAGFGLEVELPDGVVVDGRDESSDIGIIVDAGEWFVDDDGAQLNPLDSGHYQAIRNAVRRSFRHRRRLNPRFRELVGICHFEKHEGPVSRDFVLLNTLNPVICTDEGGTPTEVTRFACRYKHEAIERFEGFNCRTENLD